MLKVLLISITFVYITGLNAQVKDHSTGGQEDSVERVRTEARYKGDIKDLAKAFERKYAKKKPRPSGDSSVAFKAFVDKQHLNELQEIQLIEGSKSAFADFIRQGLIDSGKAWQPRIMGGRLVKSFIWVRARLNRDRSITITTDNYLGS